MLFMNKSLKMLLTEGKPENSADEAQAWKAWRCCWKNARLKRLLNKCKHGNAVHESKLENAAARRQSQNCCWQNISMKLHSTLVISNSKGLSEILRDIRTSTYQTCRIEEKLIPLTTLNKYMCNWTLEVRDILKIFWKRGEIAPQEQFLLFSTIFFTCC